MLIKGDPGILQGRGIITLDDHHSMAMGKVVERPVLVPSKCWKVSCQVASMSSGGFYPKQLIGRTIMVSGEHNKFSTYSSE